MAITLAQVKKYLRIDSDEEDELLESLMTTAEAYLKGAVTNFEDYYSKYDDFVSKADFAQMILVAEFYLNRDNEETKFSYATNSLMVQLQFFVVGEEGDNH